MSILLVLLALVLSSCSWGRYDPERNYLEAHTISKVTIPAGMDKPDFEEAMTIPSVTAKPNKSGKPIKVGLPAAVTDSYGVDKIIIKKLGNTRWVFLDAPPAVVWPKVREYWEARHIPLASADPRQGVMVTKWLYAKKGNAKAIFASIKKGVTEDDAGVATQQKFRLKVEPGIRSGSTELYLKQRSAPLNVPIRQDHVDWSGKSDNLALEDVVLTDMAYYLGAHINANYAVSKGAEHIGGKRKARLYLDRNKPVLTYVMSFARAWATVGDALHTARIKVVDLDRSTGNYYIAFDQRTGDRPSLLRRLLFHNTTEVADVPQNRYIVHLDSKNSKHISVTVKKNASTPADTEVAEKLLKIIKESST